jgi:pilus assembly protein CpaB
MLRRSASLAEVVVEDDDIEPDSTPPETAPLPRPAPSLARPAHLDTATLLIDPKPANRRGGMESLRAEALQSVISRVEDRRHGGLRDRVAWKRNRIGSRIVLGVVALMAGGLAAYMSVQAGQRPEPVVPEAAAVVAPPMVQVLVAGETIAAGHRLTTASLGWQDWPQDAVRDDFIVQSASPEASTELSGLIARSDILPGEPIRQQKLANGGLSVLATMLSPGMRAVSVTIDAESASGGFVAPSDYVDVVLTRTGPSMQVSDTILRDVRVLAIDTRLGDTTPVAATAEDDATGSAAFANRAIATLELDPKQAEVLINATTMGRLSLVLRASADSATGSGATSAANQSIRLSSPFWTN